VEKLGRAKLSNIKPMKVRINRINKIEQTRINIPKAKDIANPPI
jgi:hypothetical protein